MTLLRITVTFTIREAEQDSASSAILTRVAQCIEHAMSDFTDQVAETVSAKADVPIMGECRDITHPAREEYA